MNQLRRVPNLLSIVSRLASRRVRARGSLRSVCSPVVGGALASLLLLGAPGVMVARAAIDSAAWSRVSAVMAPVGIELYAGRRAGASGHAPHRTPARDGSPFTVARSAARSNTVVDAAPTANALPRTGTPIIARGYDATAPPASPDQH